MIETSGALINVSWVKFHVIRAASTAIVYPGGFNVGGQKGKYLSWMKRCFEELFTQFAESLGRARMFEKMKYHIHNEFGFL
ncbi:hypothetical protein HAX54_017498 [Datura stramonium]|uniref:Uncharacterized protein n=1 Tax=Datura stramonium TaxID=4076 RepID=A0ABS8S175_DATST|nr:hypothetical protein [Datura stramonium]